MSVQNIASPAPSQGGADRSARPGSLEAASASGRAAPRPYAAVPHDLINDARLKSLDVVLVGVLLRYARNKAVCWPAIATLAKDLRKSERTVQYALARLIAAGWVATRPAADPTNRTGRWIVLTWRETRCTPPVQLPYTQGLPRSQTVAPKEEKEREREGSAPARTEKQVPEPPMTHAELVALYEGLGWLARPLSDSLRQMADRSLAIALASPETPPAPRLTIAAPRPRRSSSIHEILFTAVLPHTPCRSFQEGP